MSSKERNILEYYVNWHASATFSSKGVDKDCSGCSSCGAGCCAGCEGFNCGCSGCGISIRYLPSSGKFIRNFNKIGKKRNNL